MTSYYETNHLIYYSDFISVFLLSFSGKNQAQTKPAALLKTLIIDPGHGGIDPGAKGSFSTEADVSLEVALKFGKALEKEFPDLKIVYTRTTDMPGNKKNKKEDKGTGLILPMNPAVIFLLPFIATLLLISGIELLLVTKQ